MGLFLLCAVSFSGIGWEPKLFHSDWLGISSSMLAFISRPFLYLDTTLSGFCRVLALAGRIFFSNVVCLLIRLLFVICAIPVIGMQGYSAGDLGQPAWYLRGIYFFWSVPFLPPKHSFLNLSHKKYLRLPGISWTGRYFYAINSENCVLAEETVQTEKIDSGKYQLADQNPPQISLHTDHGNGKKYEQQPD